MKKFLIISIIVFFLGFIYLDQKIKISVEAYKISQKYERYNKLVDLRDHILYNFARATSIDKVNMWAEKNNFKFPNKERVVVFRNSEPSAPRGRNIVSRAFSSFKKFLDVIAPGTEAEAKSE